MHGALRPNYRRARTLKMEIDALSVALQEASADETVSEEAPQDVKDELDHLRHEFFLTGVSSEYEL